MATGSNSLNLIVDADFSIFQYGPLEWTSSQYPQYYGTTIMAPAFAVGITNDSTFHAPYGTFSLTFEGNSIAFVGNTPALPSLQTILVSIDGGDAYETSYGDTTPQSYMQWYQSPVLEEGTHTVVVDQLAGTSIDYAIVNVGPNTPLAGMQVIVDNEDPCIQWSSGWTLNSDQFDAGFLPDGYAYQNSTRRSSTAGDSMYFRFQGTSVSIYGILSYFDIGMVSATFTLDGESTPQTYIVTPDDYASNEGDLPNYLLMTYENLLPQDHTLIVNITRCNSQALIMDYITYTPSFYNLALMDNLSSPLIVPPANPTQPPLISTTSSEESTFITDLSSGSPRSGEGTGGNVPQSKHIPTGAIVAVAITLLLFAIALPLLWIRARRITTQNKSLEGLKEQPAPCSFPLLHVTAQKKSIVSGRDNTYSPSGDVEMIPFRNYRQANLDNTESTDKKQQDIFDHWSNQRNVSNHYASNSETTIRPPLSNQFALVPLRRSSNNGMSGTPESRRGRRGIPSRPPPAYSAAPHLSNLHDQLLTV